MTNAQKLAAIGGGGTNCSAPLEMLVAEKCAVDVVIFVSDNQSWIDASSSNGTMLMQLWEKLKRRNPHAKLICIDIQPYGSTQATERDDVMNIGGFSDAVFEQMALYVKGAMGPEHWVGEIENITL
jgi:60 kDa SS-A/Ro ribonucleoprotein